MSYEPYRPDQVPPGPDEEPARPPDATPAPEEAGQSYEPYPAPSPLRPVPHPTAPPQLYRGRTGTSATGIVVVAAVAVGAVLIALVGARSASDSTDRGSYTSCAAEHDAGESLFSDEEWCDLELLGGNGNGLADEGGDGGPVEENSLFGDTDDYPFRSP